MSHLPPPYRDPGIAKVNANTAPPPSRASTVMSAPCVAAVVILVTNASAAENLARDRVRRGEVIRRSQRPA
ncbi:MAG: hypothetical protein ACI9W2_004210 [Gammaproteobacteria bacterium]|jgi:hypothetical protein